VLPRTIDWMDGRIALVDQTALPELRMVEIATADELVDAIQRLVVRGAPALGADVAACRAIGTRGAALLAELCGPAPLRLHTHCNARALANKIGTYPLALAAARAGVPFVVAAPESALDPDTPDGAAIEIEERAASEVLAFGGSAAA
jgi:methylthioribose-1-phosphate isomerase